MPENKIKPSSTSDSAMRVFVSFTLERVSTFWLVSTMAGFLFLHTEKHLADGVLDLSERCWAGECSSKHSYLLLGTAGQHVLPSALPSPQTRVRRCPFLFRHIHSSHSQGSANGEGVGTNPQVPYTLWAGCKPQPHPVPIQLCSLNHPLW